MKTYVTNEQRYVAGGDEGWIDLNRDFGLPEHPSYVTCENSVNTFSPEFFSYDSESIQSYSHVSQGSFLRQSPPQPSQPLFAPTHQTWPNILPNSAIQSASQINFTSSLEPSSREIESKQGGSSFSRRTLTDEDRKRMCQYHEDNPSKKQAEIGALFGVERSTVSKILRQRDKYLSSENRSLSPLKRAKGKFPDIERALSNWIRNLQKKEDYQLTDAIIREKAESFAATVGHKESFIMKINSTSWLEKFKQKNCIDTPNITGNNPEPDVKPISPSNSMDSSSTSRMSNTVSPISRCATLSPSSSRDIKEEEIDEKDVNPQVLYMELESQFNSTSKPSHNSTRSFTKHDLRLDRSMLVSSQHPQDSPPALTLPRIRSQTFPRLEINTTCPHPPAIDTSDISCTGTKSVNDFSSKEQSLTHSADLAFSPLRFKKRDGSVDLISSNFSIKDSQKTSSSLSAPSPPTRNDARKALETLVNFYSLTPNGKLIDQDEYLTVISLTEKMRFASDEN
ncbi:hypothetical protein GcM3_127007 [Golovinomyces cichoracearum]|uniref:HTH CENPB-type domain-containing protein n=1 Tax=Golovinomyces cichoracearum TaxID=62708 RepID=A0A420I5K0_9PEZI|nr:hypothetical protein GcM3_127007 [Golovinomyces cichoracearum]